MSMTIAPFDGFGLGLRKEHHQDFLAQLQPVDFVEIISENFMATGGRPLRTLDAIRERYRIAMHGVSMSIGSPAGVSMDYLIDLKTLARRVEPLWISDHLCWTHVGGFTAHDLLPLPYTDEALEICIANIVHAQNVLERPLLIENPSSYVTFSESTMSEWQFLSKLVQETNCYLLLDINNIYVSAINHGFDADTFLDALPLDRVRQIHLAGHSVGPNDMLIDTHDAEVCDAVWRLYAKVRERIASCATMIERDDAIPPLGDLLAQLHKARDFNALRAHAA